MTSRNINHGSLSVGLLVAMVVLLGSLALAVDTGFLWHAYGQLQFAADAAALAGAAELMDSGVLYAPPERQALQPILREQRIAAARQQALALAALNPVNGSPLRLDTSSTNDVDGDIARRAAFRRSIPLDANSANDVDGDIVVGWVEDVVMSAQMVPWPATEEVNSIVIRARRLRANGDPVVFRFARALGLDGADVMATARASLDQRVYGFRPAGHVRVPLMPLAIITPEASQGEAFWFHLAGTDDHTVSTRPARVTSGPDGIAEYALVFDPQQEDATEGVRLARFHTADPMDPGAQSVVSQILGGYTAADLADCGGQFALDGDGTLLVPGASVAGTPDTLPLTALRAILGQPRIWPLGTVSSSAAPAPVYTIGGFVAACVVDADEDGDGRLTIHLQPCLLQTATALVCSGQRRNPWIGKLVLNR